MIRACTGAAYRSSPAACPSQPAAAPAAPDAARAGAPIANARGVPGTLGCLAVTLHDGRLMLVSSHHVLFGAGAREAEPVWLLGGRDARYRIATTRWGRRDTVRDAGVHVDCAVAELAASGGDDLLVEDTMGIVTPGDLVTMRGGASGVREGIIVDAAYRAIARVDGCERPAPGQLLVLSEIHGRPFASAGDSGAVLRDENGAIVGVLWGVTAAGKGVACPIAMVLRVLHVRPVRLISLPTAPPPEKTSR